MWNAVVYWQGWSLVFGGLFVIQLLREWRDRHVRKAYASQLYATLEQLGIIRAQFSEALNGGEVLNTAADRAFIRATAYNLLSAENHIRTALGLRQQPAEPLPNARKK